MFCYLVIIIAAIVLDQISKYFAVLYLKAFGSLPIVEGVLHLTYSENSGAAFSILRGKQALLIGLTIVAMVAMFVYLVKSVKRDGALFQKVCLALIIGGGIGNLIDRVRLNYVVDFIDFRLINFAIFNIADSCISVGAVGLLLSLIVARD